MMTTEVKIALGVCAIAVLGLGLILWAKGDGPSRIKSWWHKKGKPDSKVQADLLGEGQDSTEQMVIPIQTMEHKDLPDDDVPYEHYHMCEACKSVFQHKHSKNKLSKLGFVPKNHCQKCIKKRFKLVQQSLAENKTCPSLHVDHADVELEYTHLDPEAVNSSAPGNHTKFMKIKSLRVESFMTPTTKSQEDVTKEVAKFINTTYTAEATDTAKETTTYTLLSPITPKPDVAAELMTPTTTTHADLEAQIVLTQSLLDVKPPTDIKAESTKDPGHLDVRTAIKKNIVRLSWGNRSLNGIGLCGRWILMPRHFFAGIDTPYISVTLKSRGNIFHAILMMKDIYSLGSSKVNGQILLDDIVLVNFKDCNTLPVFKDIRKHVCQEDDLGKAVYGEASLVVLKPEDEFLIHSIPSLQVATERATNLAGARYAVASSWTYHCGTEAGDCGSPVIAVNTSMPNKLIGIHIGGYAGETIGYAMILKHKKIMEILDGKTDTGGYVSVRDIEAYCSEVFDCTPNELPEEHGLKFVPKGRVTIFGKLKPEFIPGVQTKSSIVPSPYHDKIWPHTTEPAILTDNPKKDARAAQHPNVIQQGLDKFGKVFKPRHPQVRATVRNHRLRKWVEASKDYNGPKRTLTVHEAINGIPGCDYVDPLKMDASPGFPYVLERPAGVKGRSYLFTQTGVSKEGTPIYALGERLEKDVNSILEGLDQGEIRMNFFLDWLKDERRAFSKLHKTRYFNIHNVAWLIVIKMLFGASIAFQLWAREKLGSALGADSHGPDVKRLVEYLRSMGEKYSAYDVREWDGNAASEIMADAHTVMKDFIDVFEKDPIWIKRRKVAVGAVTTRIHIVNETVYITYQGMPSGIGTTASGNTEGHEQCDDHNYLELAAEYAEKHPKYAEYVSLPVKEENVAKLSQGDDATAGISEEVVPFYNDVSIARVAKKYGMLCTPPTKIEGQEQEPFVSFEEVEFLKSTFRRDTEYPDCWHMRMAPKVIEELTNWVTTSGPPKDLFFSNCEDLLRFSFSYGKKYYNSNKARINKVLEEHGDPPLVMKFGDFRREYLSKYGKITAVPFAKND